MKLELIVIFIFAISCSLKNESNRTNYSQGKENRIVCSDKSCEGTYIGKEFINGSDVAHQYSNKMSKIVGDKLKEFYSLKKYSKVDFEKIEMSTEGMGTGKVVYKLRIPFMRVELKCDSYTSFDHVGGWNHAPELEKRKKQLKKVLLLGDNLDISELKSTKEGLQEYWIQWRNKDIQIECLNK